MFPSLSGKPITLTCKEPAFPEFPELLFGSTNDNGTTYFDATAYLQNKDHAGTVQDFFSQYEALIRSLQSVYNMADEDICSLNQDGHILIDGSFTYLFISFVEPPFLAHILDRIHELFSSGFCVSDSYLLKSAMSRLPNVMPPTIENYESTK